MFTGRATPLGGNRQTGFARSGATTVRSRDLLRTVVNYNIEVADVRRQIKVLHNGHTSAMILKEMPPSHLVDMYPSCLGQVPIEVVLHFVRRYERQEAKSARAFPLRNGILWKRENVFPPVNLN
jgi:hypothetical protein